MELMLRFCDGNVLASDSSTEAFGEGGGPRRTTQNDRGRFSPGTWSCTGVVCGTSGAASEARYAVRPGSCLTASPDPKKPHPTTAKAATAVITPVTIFSQLHR